MIVLLVSQLGRCLGRFLLPLIFLAAGNVALSARHVLARMNDVEKKDGNPHRQRVKDVHEHLVVWDAAVDARRVLDETEDDSNLHLGQHDCHIWLKGNTDSDEAEDGVQNI